MIISSTAALEGAVTRMRGRRGLDIFPVEDPFSSREASNIPRKEAEVDVLLEAAVTGDGVKGWLVGVMM